MNEEVSKEVDFILSHQSKGHLVRIIKIGIIVLSSIIVSIAWYLFNQTGKYVETDREWKDSMMKVQKETLEEIRVIKQDQTVMQITVDTLVNNAAPQIKRTLELQQKLARDLLKISKPQPTRQEPEPLTTIQGKHESAMQLLNKVEQGISVQTEEVKKNFDSEINGNI